MTSSFAAQLRVIAANSSNELDLRARRHAHAESLLFERVIAAKQDWDTLYQTCVQGFQELCLLDPRLREFEQNLYSPQAKDQDREQLTGTQNEALGLVIDRCLALVASKLLLRPGMRAVEWLVRRFRIHVYNTNAFLTTFLPYHEHPVFRNVLSITPSNRLVDAWKFLAPYKKSTTSPARHSIVYNATNNDAFFTMLNTHVLRVCSEGAAHSQLMRYWSSVIVEAVAGRMGQVKSGRKEIQRQRLEDALLKILPVLSEGLDMERCPELTFTCLSLMLILAESADLDDQLLDSLVKSLVPLLTKGDLDHNPVLTCFSILVAKKRERKISKDVLRNLMKVRGLHERLAELRGLAPVEAMYEALIASSLVGLKRSNLDSRLRFAERLLTAGLELFEQPANARIIAVLLRNIQRYDNTKDLDSSIRTRLVQALQKLNDSASLSSVLLESSSLVGQSQADLETLLGATVESGAALELLESTAMEVDSPEPAEMLTTTEIESVRQNLRDHPVESFLAVRDVPFLEPLTRIMSITRRSEAEKRKFEDLEFWGQNSDQPSPLYLSFLLRSAFSPVQDSWRTAALTALSQVLENSILQDLQLMVPFLTIFLADATQSVRRAAVACMLALRNCLLRTLQTENGGDMALQQASSVQTVLNMKPTSPKQVLQVLEQVYLPIMEECILDPTHIRTAIQQVLSNSNRTHKTLDLELKKSLRQCLFDLLTQSALACSLMKVKTGILELLDHVRRVGTSITCRVLQPILQEWASLDSSEAATIAASEGLSLSHLDSVVMRLVDSHDNEGVEKILQNINEDNFKARSDLLRAFFDRVTDIWKNIKPDSQSTVARMLFDMSFSEKGDQAIGARGVLHDVELSTDVLASLIDHACSRLAQMHVEMPPKKRRRTSHGPESIPKEMADELVVADSQLTFTLELIENSSPETHPQILGDLFELLIVLRRLQEKSTAQSPYLLSLCLSSILAIVDKAKESAKPSIDMSVIRADLVTDCVRSAENPHVQSTALLLCASLASIAPDRTLHNIMPIFTFMGSGFLSRDDERSIYVTNQAIDQIIPPLVSTLKRQDAKNLIHATSSLLSSFVTAYDHVPQHRRISFYQRLLDRFGPEDFAFAMIALFVSRRQHQDMSPFLSDLIVGLPATTQLSTHKKLLELVNDVFSGNPHNATPLLEVGKTTKNERREKHALLLLKTATELLESKALKTQVIRKLRKDEEDARPFWLQFKTCLSRLLNMLQDPKTNRPNMVSCTKANLRALLELPSPADLLVITPDLLQEMETVGDHELKPLALRVLANQFQHNAPKDARTQRQAVAFLSTLESVLADSTDETLRHAAIACLDRLVELYGRQNSETVLRIALSLATSDRGLRSEDARTQIMSMLCLASMMEVLKESAVPVISSSMQTILTLSKSSLEAPTRNAELHHVTLTILSSFLSHVPFMVSDNNLVDIFELCYASYTASKGASAGESRVETLNLVADKLDLSTITACLVEAWKTISTSYSQLDIQAMIQYLDLLNLSITRNSKPTVLHSADSISNFLSQVLDIRRQFAPSSTSSALSMPDIDEIESKLQQLSITFIYKLNDTALRPLFENWVTWATQAPDLQDYSEIEKTARKISLFKFVNHFFGNLKSIVTSYSAYLLEAANEVLQQATKSTSTLNGSRGSATQTHILYAATLDLLTTALKFDADGFFTLPNHFSPLSTLLIGQLQLVRSKTDTDISQLVIPCIVSLVTATVDTPAHHHALNHELCQLRHHDAAAVRLAAIRTQMAITKTEDVGEEWVSNVVVGTSSTALEAGSVGVGGSGETMIYVNESLEDDDEEVEGAVRDWVRTVREMVGEDVFEV